MINNISNLPVAKTAFTGHHDKKSDDRPGKNTLPALASFFTVPGVGEYMNDQPNKKSRLAWGLGLTASTIFLAGVTSVSAALIDSSKGKGAKSPVMAGLAGLGCIASAFGLLYLKYKSAIDTYRYNPDNESKYKSKTSNEE